MDKKAMIDQAYQSAFNDELEKIAGIRSETIATLPQLSLGIGLPPALLGFLLGPKRKGDMEKQEKATLTNLIPLVAPYRAGRRLATRLSEPKPDKVKK